MLKLVHLTKASASSMAPRLSERCLKGRQVPAILSALLIPTRASSFHRGDFADFEDFENMFGLTEEPYYIAAYLTVRVKKGQVHHAQAAGHYCVQLSRHK